MAAIYDVSSVDPDALSLKNMMDQVLEKVTSVFTSYGVPLPVRCYWTMGDPAIDCEQLVVSFVQVYLGMPGDQAATPQRCHMPRTAVLTISIAREQYVYLLVQYADRRRIIERWSNIYISVPYFKYI